ncbi:MAG: hypothetical protein PHW04_07760 [Candidatus Wallbacteria bacterium]|nr:hypothetical protein [Candidatus Wallbacteria bacterium]
MGKRILGFVLVAAIAIALVPVMGCGGGGGDSGGGAAPAELALNGVANDAFLSSANNVSFYCWVRYYGQNINIASRIDWDSNAVTNGKYKAYILDSSIYNSLPHVFMFKFTENSAEKLMLNVKSSVSADGNMPMTPATTIATLQVLGPSISVTDITADLISTKIQAALTDKSANLTIMAFAAAITDAKATVATRMGSGDIDDLDVASVSGAYSNLGEIMKPTILSANNVMSEVIKIADKTATVDINALSTATGITANTLNTTITTTTPMTNTYLYATAAVTRINGTAITMGSPAGGSVAAASTTPPTFKLPLSTSDTATAVFSAEISITMPASTSVTSISSPVNLTIRSAAKRAVLNLSSISYNATGGFSIPATAVATINIFNSLTATYPSTSLTYTNVASNTFTVSGSVVTVNLTPAMANAIYAGAGSDLTEGATYTYTLSFPSINFLYGGTTDANIFNTVTGSVRYSNLQAWYATVSITRINGTAVTMSTPSSNTAAIISGVTPAFKLPLSTSDTTTAVFSAEMAVTMPTSQTSLSVPVSITIQSATKKAEVALSALNYTSAGGFSVPAGAIATINGYSSLTATVSSSTLSYTNAASNTFTVSSGILTINLTSKMASAVYASGNVNLTSGTTYSYAMSFPGSTFLLGGIPFNTINGWVKYIP